MKWAALLVLSLGLTALSGHQVEHNEKEPSTIRLVLPPLPEPEKVKLVPPPPVVREPLYITPHDVYQQVQADLARFPEHERQYLRYLTAYYKAHLQDELADEQRLGNFAVQALSYRNDMYHLEIVPGTQGTLLRMRIDNYRWDPQVWERLALEDRYFHARQQRTTTTTTTRTVEKKHETFYHPGGYVGGKYYPPGNYYHGDKNFTEKKEVIEKQEEVVDANKHIDSDLALQVHALSHSCGPVLRVDWFITKALFPPFYYDFLGLEKTLDEFRKNNAAVDPALVEKFEKDRRAAIFFSGVANNNRVVERWRSYLGAYYFTFDTDSSVGKTNYNLFKLNLGGDNFVASEQIFSLPCGLHGYILFNNKGERQDDVPQKIASNHHSTNNDKTIYNGFSCMVCHVDGILTFTAPKPDLRGQVDLRSPSPRDLEKLKQLYDKDFSEFFPEDQKAFKIAVASATSLGGKLRPWDSATLSEGLKRIYREYHDDPVTPEKAALDLGVPPEKFQVYFADSQRPEIHNQAVKPPLPSRRDQWEEAYPEAAVFLLPYYQSRR